MAADPVSGAIVASAVIGAVGSLIGGSQSAKAAKKQAEMHNEAMHRKLGYDQISGIWKLRSLQLIEIGQLKRSKLKLGMKVRLLHGEMLVLYLAIIMIYQYVIENKNR